MLRAALAYRAYGLSVIPLRPKTKEAAIRWSKYQREMPTETEIRSWFAIDRNIGIVCGSASGGLVVRDFDDGDAYAAWAYENPDLARALPTVKTLRGYHVYFRVAGECPRLWVTDSGEVRGAGGYVVAPPSTHPDGEKYKWIVPLSALSLRVVEPVFFGVKPVSPEKKTDRRGTEED
jgi:hypothetical protein